MSTSVSVRKNWCGGLAHRTTAGWGEVWLWPGCPLKKWKQPSWELRKTDCHMPGTREPGTREPGNREPGGISVFTAPAGPDEREEWSDQTKGQDDDDSGKVLPPETRPVKLPSRTHHICEFLGFVFPWSLQPRVPLSPCCPHAAPA